jgi:hypothetical protein
MHQVIDGFFLVQEMVYQSAMVLLHLPRLCPIGRLNFPLFIVGLHF